VTLTIPSVDRCFSNSSTVVGKGDFVAWFENTSNSLEETEIDGVESPQRHSCPDQSYNFVLNV
jgi:hypothetical protein